MHLKINGNPGFMTTKTVSLNNKNVHPCEIFTKQEPRFSQLNILFKVHHKDDKNKFCMGLLLMQNEKLLPGSLYTHYRDR